MTADRGRVLCGLARAALAHHLHGGPEPAADGAWLDEPGAAFVTLTQGDEHRLRGCIGTLQAYRSLRDDVTDNAVAAATRDPRFPPLDAAELDRTRIEVSVLSVPEPVPLPPGPTREADAVAALRPHVDGVILRHGHHRGTFLPQVWQQLPDPARFLTHLKRKAGLADDWWQPDVRLQRYTVTAYREE